MSTPLGNSSTTSTATPLVNGKQSNSSGSLNGSGKQSTVSPAPQQQQQQPSSPQHTVPLSVISVSSSPAKLASSTATTTPSSPIVGNVAHPNNQPNDISSSLPEGIPSNAKMITNRIKVDYKFEDYEESFFAKQVINDPLKISLIPDLLTIHSVPRQTKVVGNNIPVDIVVNKLPIGIQESMKVFSQEWTVVTRDTLPTPAGGVVSLKPLSVQAYECDEDFEATTGTPADAVKDCNKELIDISQVPIPDPKIIDSVKNNRIPLFQTHFADELQPIELPKVGRQILESQSFQFQVECNEFKTLIGDIEPFFGRMFLFDANAEDSKNQIISEIFHFDFNTHQDILPKSTDVLEQATRIKKAVFTINRPSTHVYLIICFDKVMRGDPEETTKIYFNLPGKPKEVQKFQSEVKESIPRLGNFKQPFVWGCLELFDQNNQFLYNTPDINVKVQNLTRIKGDLYNFVTKPEKKQTQWCDCSVRMTIINETFGNGSNSSSTSSLNSSNNSTSNNNSGGRIDYLLRPIGNPIPTTSTSPASREMLTFDNPSEPNLDMNIAYSNVLYFYPKSVNLNNFKSDKGSSARNIFLEVKLLEDDTNVNNGGMRSIYGQSGQPLLTRRFYTSVGYHNRKPKFTDEIKINLPANLTSSHHILVTFYHLGCRASKKGEKPEVSLGHCAIRLFENDQILVDNKYKRPVATVFPPKYLDIENTKWVDNKKPVFAFRTRLISSIYPQDNVLSYILREGAESDQNQLIEVLKRINEVPNTLKLNFFPALSRVLFKCIASLSKDLQKHAFIALLTVVESISKELKQEDKLLSYCTYIFNNAASSNSLYESIVQTWISILETKEDKICVLSLQYSWFLFTIIRKSMIIDIDIKNLLKNGRNRTNRFSDEYLQKFKMLFELLLIQLKQMYNVKLMIAKSFIVHVAYFITDLLDIMNRGFLFKLIHSYVTALDSSNTVMELTELKFTFLRVIASSDSFIPLNLPSTFQFPDILDTYNHFYKKHILIGLVLQEVSNVLTANEKEMRLKGILTLREIMSRNDTSDHYNTPTIRERLAALYFPFILIVVENFDTIYKFDQAELKNWLICFVYVVKNLINSNMITDWWKKETQKSKIGTFFTILSHCATVFEYGGEDSLNSSSIANSTSSNANNNDANTDSPQRGTRKEGKVSIFKKSKGNGQQINREAAKVLLEQYTNNLSKSDRTYSISQSSSPVVHSSSTVPNSPISHSTTASSSTTSAPGTPGGFRSFHKSINLLTSTMEPAVTAEVINIMHGNLSHEVSLTILNCLVIYIKENKAELLRSQQYSESDAVAAASSGKLVVSLDKIFKTMTLLIKKEQSHAFLRIAFLVLSSMINEFKIALFRNHNTICSELTPEIFQYCTVNHGPNRQFATTLIYLLIHNNLREMGHFARMKLQSTVSISKIVSENVKVNDVKDFEALYACLQSVTKFVKQYCNNNLLTTNNNSHINNTIQSSPSKQLGSPLKTTTPPPSSSYAVKQQQPISQQIEELRDRLFGVIRNSVKIQQHGYDPEMKADLYHQLSNTFVESPDLRITWLKSLAGFLQTNQNWEEAAQTYIITAALVCGYLKLLKRFPKNLAVEFSNVSTNIALDLTLPDPSLLEAVEGEVCQLEDFTEKGFISLLKEAVKVLKRGSFFESCIETYQLLLPTYQKNREWKRQYECYSELVVLCNQMISESTVNQRLFANYYRVAYYGEEVIPELHNKEYIYKELNFVRLSDISERLQKQFGDKFGEDKIHVLPNKPVDRTTLNPGHIYLQIISVEPYLLPEELKERVSTFDQNTNLNKFIFEVPFTKSGKAHGDGITDQWKRKTILTTVSYFPYLKKRLLIIKKEDIELTPIEASIEIIQKKTQALRAELNSTLPNTKTLQINLQGSLLLQVNAGPIAICNSFLDENEYTKHNSEHITKLQDCVRDFTSALGFSVKLNQSLTKDDGSELQAQLDKGYQEFRRKVKQYVVFSGDDD